MASCSVSPRPDAAWQQLYPRDSPPSRLPLGMVYDPATSQMLLLVTGSYGEVGLTPASLLAHTWLWEKGTWKAQAALRTETNGWFPGAQKASGPSLLAGGSADLVYDAATRSVILYNGFMTGPWVPGGPHSEHYGNLLNHFHSHATPAQVRHVFEPQTWAWNGSHWTMLHPPQNPPQCLYNRMAYDATTRTVVVLCSRVFHGSYFKHSSQTWLWNGRTWLRQFPLRNPPGVDYLGTMAYDAAARKVVLFGGLISPCSDRRCASTSLKTWTWNGTTWTRQYPPVAPPPARRASNGV